MSSRDLSPRANAAWLRGQDQVRSSAGAPAGPRRLGELHCQMAEHPLSMCGSEPAGWNCGTCPPDTSLAGSPVSSRGLGAQAWAPPPTAPQKPSLSLREPRRFWWVLATQVPTPKHCPSDFHQLMFFGKRNVIHKRFVCNKIITKLCKSHLCCVSC